MSKRNAKCRCAAYPFPHRVNGGRCSYDTQWEALLDTYCLAAECAAFYSEPDVNWAGCRHSDASDPPTSCPVYDHLVKEEH